MIEKGFYKKIFLLSLFTGLLKLVFFTEIFTHFLLGNFSIIALHLLKFTFPDFLLYLCFGFSRKILAAIFTIYNLLFALHYYFSEKFAITIDCGIISAVFESYYGEVIEFLSLDFILLSCTIIALSTILILTIYKKGFKFNSIFFIFLVSSFALSANLNFFSKNSPLHIIGCTQEFLTEKYKIIEANHSRISLANEFKYNPIGENQTIIFIIGESARGENFSLNGYERETNPELAKIKNIKSFKNVVSCTAKTRTSVPCLLTRASAKNIDVIYEEKSFIHLFKENGFKTYWLSMNDSAGFNNTTTSSFANEAEYTDFRNYFDPDYKLSNDLLLLENFKKIYKSEEKQLIILHMRGSHWSYEYRYTDKFKRFQPACAKASPKDCSQQSLVNAYDNTILMTDYFISEVIKTVKNDNSFVMFTSDHGESLGESGHYLHNYDFVKEQRDVPLIIWFSDKYLNSAGENAQSNFSKPNASINAPSPLTHEYIFHTIVGCSGFESELIKDSNNLCAVRDSKTKNQ